MGLDGAPGHLELFGNFCVVTAFQQQVGDLLLPWTEPNRRFLHRPPQIVLICPKTHSSLPVRELCAPQTRGENKSFGSAPTNVHSTHWATLCYFLNNFEIADFHKPRYLGRTRRMEI